MVCVCVCVCARARVCVCLCECVYLYGESAQENEACEGFPGCLKLVLVRADKLDGRVFKESFAAKESMLSQKDHKLGACVSCLLAAV